LTLLAAFGISSAAWSAELEPANPHEERRRHMVERQIEQRGVTNQATLKAMRNVPRHRFVPKHLEDQAYSDHPLPIGHGQTISQPYIVGLMTEMLALKPDDKVLEIGTGSGYQAAVLHAITTNTYTMEIVPELAEQAGPLLADSGLNPGQVRQGDGYFGWEVHAPFDAIIVTAAADHIPPSLLRQLRPGGRMVIPIGPVHATQRLVLVTKDDEEKVRTRSVLPVRFVPLTGGPRNRD
jgi:protein-L-isoaspartate(D-aspartate) O-methyltransferase